MRLVKRNEFLELPVGTLYCVLEEPWIFGSLEVKGDTIDHNGKLVDFYSRALTWVDAEDSIQAILRLEGMLADSNVSFPVEQAFGREGMFDEHVVYLVYESADVKTLLNDLLGAYGDLRP